MEYADFYLGRGPAARWMGSVKVMDASPEGSLHARVTFTAPDPEREPFGDSHYAQIIDGLLDVCRPVATPADGWPHKYPDSTETRWTYAWDKGSLYVYEDGVEVVVIRANGARKVSEFPKFIHGENHQVST